jgi:hypothetical protein
MMSEESPRTNLPAAIADAIISVPKGLVPGVIKSLDRLLGAAIDVPVAWLAQKKAQIDGQTKSYNLVEGAIAKLAAKNVASDPDITHRAISVLVRDAYRKQSNREAIAEKMIEDLRLQSSINDGIISEPDSSDLDDDWLNLFGRYAEDASSERLQGLWGRVLSGQIRKPNRFSTRTLRFLSEFSQSDAMAFERFAHSAFGNLAPTTLVKPNQDSDIKDLIDLEASGLIQGASGFGLQVTLPSNQQGNSFVFEDEIAIVFRHDVSVDLSYEVINLTPLGQELLHLVSNRSAVNSAKTVALAMRRVEHLECSLVKLKKTPIIFL